MKTYRFFLFVTVLILSTLYGHTSSQNTEGGINDITNPVSSQVKSDLFGITISISFDTNSSYKDYVIEGSTLIEDSKNIIKIKQGEEGFIKFPAYSEVYKKFVIPQNQITAIVKTKYDMGIYERTDYVFTKDSLYVINTTQKGNTNQRQSEVFVLPSLDSKLEYEDYLQDKHAVAFNKKLFNQVINFCLKNNVRH